MAYVGGGERQDEGCVLCAVAEGRDNGNRVVERAEHTVTVLNLYPYSSGHVMVVPRRHVADVVDLQPAEAAAVFEGAQRAVRALREALRPDGFNLGVNLGTAAGAGIADHVHLHVVPRWAGDTNFMPVLADVKVIPEHMEQTAARLREAYEKLTT
jgi:ATP adenylyltransferase